MTTHPIQNLPFTDLEQIETRSVLKKVAEANRYLAELKGVSSIIPNEAILTNTLSLQEAKHSSAIENIVTTHDEMYKAELFNDIAINPAAKEVQDYAIALYAGSRDSNRTGNHYTDKKYQSVNARIQKCHA